MDRHCQKEHFGNKTESEAIGISEDQTYHNMQSKTSNECELMDNSVAYARSNCDTQCSFKVK